MIYKEFKGEKLSALGLGCMRFPTIDGKEDQVDEAQVAEMFEYAIKNGINYFDTAYVYHGRTSETVVGKMLKKYPRDSFYLATKFPGMKKDKFEIKEQIFEEQLKKCQVDYFDFYLFHNVSDISMPNFMDDSFGLYDYLMEQKKSGRIKHLGFSTHASLENMEKFIKKYRDGIEFCQIELNYLDWTFQDAKGKVELLNKYEIPIWVMEPLRGGQLAKLKESDVAQLKSVRPDEGIPAWGFRFLQTIDNVVVTLSGMSNMEQLKANIETYQTEKPLTEEEKRIVLEVADGIISKTTVPCTGCHYCVKGCPMELDIPELLKLYNDASVARAGGFERPQGLRGIPEGKMPADCIGCGQCRSVCPQGINIPEELATFAEKLEKTPDTH